MGIICDIDGAIFYPHPYFKKIIPEKEIIRKKSIPAPIVRVGLFLAKISVDEEMIIILSQYLRIHSIYAHSGRPINLEKYTISFFKKNEINFFEEIKCFGMDNIVEKKVENAKAKKVDYAIDDDEMVIKEMVRAGISAHNPQQFKLLHNSGVIK